MKSNKPFLFFVVFSLAFHALAFFTFRIYIHAKKTPSFYAWPDIVDKDTLFSVGSFDLAQKYLVNSDKLSRKIFMSTEIPEESKIPDLANLILLEADFNKNYRYDTVSEPAKNYIYLWKRSKIFYPFKEEAVSYKVLVSPQGKVIFSYPEKLPFNSQENLYFQAYIREAALFFTNRFFWTKLEGVVK